MSIELKKESFISQFLQNRPLAHITFWISYICFYGTSWGSYNDEYARAFICESSELLIKLPVVYFVLFRLIDKYLFERKYVEFFIYTFVTVVIASIAIRLFYYYVLYPPFFPERVGSEFFVAFRILRTFTNVFTLAIMVVAIKLLKKWYYDQQEAKSLEKEKLEAELKFLKSQVHPHFLFNTLNNLYSLTLKKSDNAPEIVLKLSELMSYMLYDTSARQVSLSKEINYINHYIDLEKIRYGDRLDISFNTHGNVTGKMIAPMLLLPFIENSFKHGVSGELETVWISLDLHVESNKLIFKVENSKSPEEENVKISSYRSGIGLKNVKRRLDLIYGKDYDLKILDEKDTFLVVLKLKLATTFEVSNVENPEEKVLQK